MKRWQRGTLGAGVFLVLVAGFTAFILPGIVKSRAIRAVEEATGRKLAIGDVSINPVTWNAEVKGVRLTERDGTTTFASFSSARVAVSPASIFRGAPVVSEARLRSPYVHLVRTGANTYNFSDLLEKKGPEKQEKPTERARFAVSNIVVTNGAIDFIDRGLAAEKRHRVSGLELGIPFVSTIPHYADSYIAPRFRAVVNGSPLALDGKLKPFASAAEYSLDIYLKELDVPYYLAYVPAKLPVRVERGTAATKLVLTYRTDASRPPELLLSGELSLAGLKAAGADGAPLAALDRLGVVVGRSELLAPAISLTSVTLDAPVFNLSRDKKGVWNVVRLAQGEQATPPPAKPHTEPRDTAKGKPVIDVGEVTLRNGTVTVADALPPGGFRTESREVAGTVRGFSTRPGKKADYTLSFATGRNETVRITGGFSPDPMAVTAMADVKGIVLESFYPYLAGVLNGPIKGRADVGGEVAYGDGAVSADKVAIRFTGLAVDFGPKEGVLFRRAALEGGHYSQKENLLEFETITVTGADLSLSRREDGSFSPLALLKTEPPARKEPPRPKGTSGPPFRYRTKKFVVNGLDATFTDRKTVGNPAFKLTRGDLTVQNLVWPEREAMPYRVSARYGRGGAIASSGTLRPAPFSLKGETTLRRIPLTDFDAYLPEGLNVILADGSLDTRLTYTLAARGKGLGGTFGGSIGVRSFHCLDAAADDLLTWESLQIDKVSGSLEPFSLKVGEVSVAKLFSKIVIDRDGRLNLQKLYTPEAGDAKVESRDAGEGAPAIKPAQAAQPTAPQAAPPAKPQRQITIDAVTIQAGTLAFSDRHMNREYDTTLYNLGGRISGLSSEESRFAEVDLRGNLENLSPLQITGKLNPLRDDLYADITVRFNDIDLTPLTPYSGTYVGYGIDRGKVSFDLKYLIENKQLNSENKVFIDQLTFGEKIESDKATNLPVRLAVALLKDRKGEIHLDLPVTGRTDDPQFSVWRVVWQIIKNLLVKAATSPFSLLQSAFGGKEDFSVIPFAPGSTHLAEAEQAKLAKIAQALNDRPSLKVDIKGYVDKERDPEGYRAELLNRKIKGEKFLVLVKEKRNQPGDSAESMAIAPDEASRYLKAVYNKEKFPKPRNALGLEKGLPDAEMKKLILANTQVGEGELKALAAERAGAVKACLAGAGKVDPARLFLKADDIYKAAAEKGSSGRVEFGAAVE